MGVVGLRERRGGLQVREEGGGGRRARGNWRGRMEGGEGCQGRI